MSLHINIPRGVVWHPGDVVSGKVIFESTEQMNVDNFDLTFEGKMRTREVRSRGQNGSVTYRGKVDLFNQRTNLFKGPYTLPATKKEWPFQFQIPSDCRHARRPDFGYHGNALLNFNPSDGGRILNFDMNQTLPPSMDESNDAVFARSRRECSISYLLLATCTRPGIFRSSIEAWAPLHIQPHRSEEYRAPPITMTPWSDSYLIKSYYLDPRMEDRTLTFKEKMKSTFGSKEIPQVWFRLTVKLPSLLVAGQRIPVFMSVEQTNKDESTSAKAMPNVALKSFRVILQAVNFMMVEGGEGIFSDKDHVDEFGASIIAEHWKGSVLLGGDLDIRGLPDVRVPFSRLVPSFSSFLISRAYRIRVEGEIECAQKKESFVATKYTREVFVLPGDCPDSVAAVEEPPSINDPAYVENTGSSNSGDQLPTYHAVMKS